MNANKRSAFTDAGPSQQTSASKRPKVGEGDGGNKPDANPTPSSAADRFFRVPELVKIVAEYICLERVDLISLAAVCKSSRMPALQVWATHLDTPLDAAEKRLQLFGRHRALLHSVRFLRIRAGFYEYTRAFQDASGESHHNVKLWEAIFQLLALFSSVKGRERGPFIDLSFILGDARRILDLFRWISPAARVVAIRLTLTDLVDHDAYSGSSDSKAELPDTNDDNKNDENDEGSLKWTERKQEDAEVVWISSWLALSELVAEIRADAKTNGGPGLQIFQLGKQDHPLTSAPDWLHRPSRIPMLFWSSLANNASSTLSEFSIVLSGTDDLASILDLLTLPKLETFSLMTEGPFDVDRLDAFLSRHLHLEALSVVVEDGDHDYTLKLQQTFPNLRWLDVDCNLPPKRQVLRFIKRHPSIEGIHAPVVTKRAAHADDSDNPSLMYGQIRTLYSEDLEDYEVIVNGGGRPSRIVFAPDSFEGPDMAELVSCKWWLDRQDVAHALTCLDFNHRGQALDELICGLDFTSDKKALPNLTELAVHELNPLKSEKDLEELFARLVYARALRVLRISERARLQEADVVLGKNKSFVYNADELLANHSFPPSFEYFQWTGVHRGDPTYFRFLPTHDATSSMPASTSTSSEEGAALTKRGRLQRIPSLFRTKISPIGVWDAPFDPERASVILDHSGVVPSLAL